LITNLPVKNHADAVHKLSWYARRWTIETFFKTLKTGCRIEDIRLTTADRLANCIAHSSRCRLACLMVDYTAPTEPNNFAHRRIY
jgi:hypothetical protein